MCGNSAVYFFTFSMTKLMELWRLKDRLRKPLSCSICFRSWWQVSKVVASGSICWSKRKILNMETCENVSFRNQSRLIFSYFNSRNISIPGYSVMYFIAHYLIINSSSTFCIWIKLYYILNISVLTISHESEIKT